MSNLFNHSTFMKNKTVIDVEFMKIIKNLTPDQLRWASEQFISYADHLECSHLGFSLETQRQLELFDSGFSGFWWN